jgi:hypothetical protein
MDFGTQSVRAAALSQRAEPALARDVLVSASDVREALEFYEKVTKRFVVPKGVSEHQDQFVQGWLAKAEHTAPQPEQSELAEALGAFVSLAEDRLHELGALSPEMAECLTIGRAALTSQP